MAQYHSLSRAIAFIIKNYSFAIDISMSNRKRDEPLAKKGSIVVLKKKTSGFMCFTSRQRTLCIDYGQFKSYWTFIDQDYAYNFYSLVAKQCNKERTFLSRATFARIVWINGNILSTV